MFGYLFESLDADVKKAGALLSWLSANNSLYSSNMTRDMYKEATDPNTPAGAVKLKTSGRLSKEQFFAVLCRQVHVPATYNNSN